jgi:hypothetical protein
MRKSDLLHALQTEIQKHDLSTFMSDKHKIVQTGCSICQKHFGTVEQPTGLVISTNTQCLKLTGEVESLLRPLTR